MTLFGSNKNNNNTNDPNDIPRDGGFGRNNLAKHDQAQGHAGGAMHNHGADDVYGANTTMEPTYGGNSGIRGHDARAGDRDYAMSAGQRDRDPNVNDRDFAVVGNGGQGQGYNDSSNMGGGAGGRGMGMQGGGDYTTSNERGMGGGQTGGGGGGYGNKQYGNQGQGQNQNQMGGGGGGFISDSHAQRLYRDGEERRLQSQQQPRSGAGGINSGSGGAGVGGAGTQTMNPTTATNTSSATSNNNTGGIPHNSQSLATQAEQKARESDAMQKQAVEVSKAEELEKAAMAARSRAVEHGAHPLHGHQGGLEAAKNRGTQA